MDYTQVVIADVCIHLGTLSDEIPRNITGPMAVLLPASDGTECKSGLAMIPVLLANHCNQISCVGPFAEKLHDQIDDVLEDLRRFDVITTFHTDAVEAVEYFIFAARVTALTLLALVRNHPDTVDALLRAESSA